MKSSIVEQDVEQILDSAAEPPSRELEPVNSERVDR